MARADLVRRLVAAYGRGNDGEFRRVVSEIVDDERRAGHNAVASALDRELNEGRGPGLGAPTSLRPIPKARDDRPLLRVGKARYDEADLVLDADVRRLLVEVAREHRRRSTLLDYGVRPRSRLLFVGPPGTGKSATAEALAAELSVPVAHASLTAITSSFLGDTSRNLDAVVQFARAAPCLLLVDEVDVLGQDRGRADDHGELRRVAATLLQVLEDDPGESVVVATSNHPGSLDSALWRRFDDVVIFTEPDLKQRAELLDLRLRVMDAYPPATPWARRLDGASAADVELVAREAVRRALVDDRRTVSSADVEHALERFRQRRRALGQPGDVPVGEGPSSSE
ncbi:AAA family ATPase [Actinomycetospora rhizophila]|uniref:AAA family ATPase n=1 Tax=Actinomycetospora rhizophila TaxID=1416876 RepID=A0ABV9Z952_9PSEU